jgi:hypothetical protein
MPELAIRRKERLARFVQKADTAVCVAIFVAASLPALVVMVLIAFPLLPVFGVWVSWVASTGGPAGGGSREEPRGDVTNPADHPPGHVTPTPHYA